MAKFSREWREHLHTRLNMGTNWIVVGNKCFYSTFFSYFEINHVEIDTAS
jgi:hypothetical protein